MHLDAIADPAGTFARDGFLSPVDILTAVEAAGHRARMEEVEAKFGPLHYEHKIHTVLCSPYELAVDPRALDIVESLIGPDILLQNVTYIVKEANSPGHVSWHQDLTYWGYDDDALVSMWLALSPASADSGCMRMIPASHLDPGQEHLVTDDPTNLLDQGQTVRGVDEGAAVICSIRPGQASFHHGWTLHSSLPNHSDDRRIGVNVQYLAPRMRQTKHDMDSAMLVRGEDRFGHFGVDIPPDTDLEPAALARREKVVELYIRTVGSA